MPCSSCCSLQRYLTTLIIQALVSIHLGEWLSANFFTMVCNLARMSRSPSARLASCSQHLYRLAIRGLIFWQLFIAAVFTIIIIDSAQLLPGIRRIIYFGFFLFIGSFLILICFTRRSSP